MPRWAFPAVALVLWFGALSSASAQPLMPLTIVTRTGEHRFQVELVDTPEGRSRGLMFRRSMPLDRGMLFDFETDQNISMWMRNTYIPLDMVFIRADGTVARVAHSTTPFSMETIEAGEPVRAVLELNADTARRIGLTRGDKVRHPLFGTEP